METSFRSRPPINNSLYDELGDQWYSAQNHPIALLRAESNLKTPWIHERAKQSLSPRCQILDIGCGAGFLSNSLAKLGYTVTGVDISEASLSVARKFDSTRKVQYLQADAYQLPFASRSFDVVTAMDFLEHVEEPARVIQEAARVLKKGGLFFFHTFNRNWISFLVAIKGVEWFVKNTPKNLHLVRLFIKPKEMRNFCKNAGLSVREMEGIKPLFGIKHVPFLIRGEVPSDFTFGLTRSLKISYLGYAILPTDHPKNRTDPTTLGSP